MNKIILLTCVVAAAFFVNAGLSIKAQVDGLSGKSRDISARNDQMRVEIADREFLPPRPPVAISKAFNLFINEIRYLEEFSGTTMNLNIEKSQDNEDISKHYAGSRYRGIKKLPVMLEVDKFSGETDMGAVLNDIYQLETETDFKAVQIDKDGNTLIVKGDVYGL